MNQDIAYNVLSYLNVPKAYRNISRSFESGSLIALKEYIEYVKKTYPLMFSSVDSVRERLGISEDDEFEIEDITHILEAVLLFYFNKMALNDDWYLFLDSISKIDPVILNHITIPIIDMLHINDNDQFAFKIYRRNPKGLNFWSNRYSRYPYQILRYYDFYSKEPTDYATHGFIANIESIGYIPQEVIDFYDKYPQDLSTNPTLEGDILSAIVNRKFNDPKSNIYFLEGMFLKGIPVKLMKLIIKIAKDYPYENVYELITHLDPSLTHNEDVLNIMLKDPYVYNRRMLDFIKEVMIELDIKPNIRMPSIVIAYLQDIWVNNKELRTTIDEKLSSLRMNLSFGKFNIPKYIAIKQAERIPVTEDELIKLMMQ